MPTLQMCMEVSASFSSHLCQALISEDSQKEKKERRRPIHPFEQVWMVQAYNPSHLGSQSRVVTGLRPALATSEFKAMLGI